MGGSMRKQATSDSYVKPVVRDYGDLLELTAATDLAGPEDGGNKNIIHHS